MRKWLRPSKLSLVSGVLSIMISMICDAQEIEFKIHGKNVRHLRFDLLRKLVNVEKVKVFEPHDGIEHEYLGFPFKKLLTTIYGKRWLAEEEVLFTCSDGYQPSIPVSRFQKYEAYLVFKRSDSNKFIIQNKLNNETVLLAPFYLIWNNLNDAYLKMMGAQGWPYQVTTLDLVKFSDRFPKMTPPSSNSISVRRGFESFRENCMTCHSISGEGGTKSIDLNLPKNATEYHDDAWLRKWIANPKGIRPGTTMPALNPALPERDQVISDIISYLKTMAKVRR